VYWQALKYGQQAKNSKRRGLGHIETTLSIMISKRLGSSGLIIIKENVSERLGVRLPASSSFWWKALSTATSHSSFDESYNGGN